MTTLYGIRNCDTVKKARAWLDAAGIGHAFHDYKTAGVDHARLTAWADALGWEALLNRSGTTFRKLPPADTADLDRERALELMATHPSLIRRPVVEHDGALLIGFKAERFAEAFGG
jgi:Spx/MgsR family transcriptional regulator